MLFVTLANGLLTVLFFATSANRLLIVLFFVTLANGLLIVLFFATSANGLFTLVNVLLIVLFFSTSCNLVLRLDSFWNKSSFSFRSSCSSVLRLDNLLKKSCFSLSILSSKFCRSIDWISIKFLISFSFDFICSFRSLICVLIADCSLKYFSLFSSSIFLLIKSSFWLCSSSEICFFFSKMVLFWNDSDFFKSKVNKIWM